MINGSDNVLSEADRIEIHEFLLSPIGWKFGWKSNFADQFSFWHVHFAGQKDVFLERPHDCAEELKAIPILYKFWELLKAKHLINHTLVRCYANAQPYGCEGTVHTDSKAPNSFTTIYYPHGDWNPDWAGETLFFNEERTDLIAAVYPRANRLISYSGVIPHVARSVSRTCPVVRITLMFKTELRL